jgi:hypothetical protein
LVELLDYVEIMNVYNRDFSANLINL